MIQPVPGQDELEGCGRKGIWRESGGGDDGENGDQNELASSWIVSVDIYVSLTCSKQNQKYGRIPTIYKARRHPCSTFISGLSQFGVSATFNVTPYSFTLGYLFNKCFPTWTTGLLQWTPYCLTDFFCLSFNSPSNNSNAARTVLSPSPRTLH